MTLKGEYSHNIDPKGRLIIPAKLRDGLGEHFVITKGMENCLYVYPEAEWNAFEEKLNALPTTTDKNARKFAYFFQGSATDGELDKQGRTLICGLKRLCDARQRGRIYRYGEACRDMGQDQMGCEEC